MTIGKKWYASCFGQGARHGVKVSMEKQVYSIILITSAREEVEYIARNLLDRKKGACVNIIPEVHSLFWWQGKIESGRESLLVVKTRTSLLSELIDLVKSVHSYEVPEIIALPFIDGNADYLDWICQETP